MSFKCKSNTVNDNVDLKGHVSMSSDTKLEMRDITTHYRQVQWLLVSITRTLLKDFRRSKCVQNNVNYVYIVEYCTWQLGLEGHCNEGIMTHGTCNHDSCS